jgi:hypothetical protein
MRVVIELTDYTSGMYLMSENKDGEINVPDDIWDGYLRHLAAVQTWQKYIQALYDKNYKE